MEKYQRKRLQPLALAVCVLVLAPFVLVPVSQALSPEPSTTVRPSTPLQTIRPRHTTTATDIITTTPAATLEGMTLDAPIRRPASPVVTDAA